DDPVASRQGPEVARDAEVAVKELHAEAPQLRAVGLAARADEVVDPDELMADRALRQRAGERAPDKAAGTGDEDAHGVAWSVAGGRMGLGIGLALLLADCQQVTREQSGVLGLGVRHGR